MEGHATGAASGQDVVQSPDTVHLTEGVVDDPQNDVRFRGACGGYLRTSKSFAKHQIAHPVDVAHITEALATLSIPRRSKLHVTVDLGRVVGMDHRTRAERVGMQDPILVARRRERKIPTRVVVGIEPLPTSKLTLVACQDHLREMVLVTAYYGRTAPPEPLGEICSRSPAEMKAALEFWTQEALIWDEQQYSEEPFATTWERMLSSMWRADAPYVERYPDLRWAEYSGGAPPRFT